MKTVLIVDDAAFMRMTIKAMLVKTGSPFKNCHDFCHGTGSIGQRSSNERDEFFHSKTI